MELRSLAKLGEERGGAVALIVALSIFVVAAAAGASVDLFRLNAARGSVQEAADAAALAAAASTARNESDMASVARRYMAASLASGHLKGDVKTELDYLNDEEVRLTITGGVDTAFMKLAGVEEMPFSITATAVRGTPQQVEVALVLDNTWSMSITDGGGVRRIDALKSSANILVDEIMNGTGKNVRVGVVPYADYVNVGVANRAQAWLSVPADYSTTTEKKCETKTEKTTCTQKCTKGAKQTCTRYVDGAPESYDCTPSTCEAKVCKTETVPPYQTCSGGQTTNYKWYGCVGSRKEGGFRLNDKTGKTYPGFLGTSQACLNPIIPLTNDRNTVKNALNGMIINIGTGYRPLTYIPTGVLWGINVLSPTAPFDDGRGYDPDNQDPRKIMVLMTDGENTLRFDPGKSDGRNHVGPSGGNAGTVQIKATNDDTLALCAYAKDQKIEVFTVAFALDNLAAKSMLRTCASDSEHYFDASDSGALQSSFRAIAKSINTVRLKH